MIKAWTTIIQKFLVAAYLDFVKNLSLSLYTAYVTKNDITNPITTAPNVSRSVNMSLHKNLETKTQIVKVIAIAIAIQS